MTRPWRIQFPGAVYHVTSRGNNRQSIFKDDSDRKKFLNLLERASLRFRLHIFAFCLMSNHYHLFLRTPDGNLASAMHWLNTTYTSYFHHRNGYCGHLLQRRYKAVLVTEEPHWLHLSMYIHLNPVRAGIVDDPASYEWSSFRDYTRARERFKWLMPDEILLQYGRNLTRGRRAYRMSCLELSKKPASFFENIRAGVVLGSREAIEDTFNKYSPKGKQEDVRDFTKTKREAIDIDKELSRVAGIFKVKPEMLKYRRRNFPPKQAAYYHLVENCSIPVTRVAQILGVKQTALSNGISRFRKNLDKDKNMKKKMNALSVK
jgi:putative transposase